MREKPVSPARLEKYITFLLEVKKNNIEYNPNCPVTLSEFVKMHEVSSAAPSVLEELGFIKRLSKKEWRWTTKAHNHLEKTIALKLLDFLLHKNKKTVHVPIPEFAGIADSLKTIADRLAEIYVQQQKSLKSPKNASAGNSEADLFRIDDQRVYIAGQIASGIYSICDIENLRQGQVVDCNDLIIAATNDLLNKLRNK